MSKKNQTKNGENIKRRSQTQEIWRNYRKSFNGMLGLVMVIAIFAVAVWANVHYDYDTQVIAQNIVNARKAPSAEHWFGTDALGRDIFTRVLYAARFSCAVAFASVGVSCTVGITLGSIAGFYGGLADTVIMRVVDVIMAVPNILFAMTIVAAFGQNLTILILALAIGGIPAMVRITRASVMQVRGQEFVEAARATGVGDFMIIVDHVLPNCMSNILVQATLRAGTAIIGIASLSFLGMGVSAPMPEWGAMLSEGRAYVRGYSYMTLFPGIAIMLTVLGLNLMGDGLRDAMDPKLKK